MTNTNEDFVLANDIDSGFVILGCEANLKFLCLDADDANCRSQARIKEEGSHIKHLFLFINFISN